MYANYKGRQGVEHVDDAMKGTISNIVLLLMKLKGVGVPSALVIQLHCKLLYLQMPQKNSLLSYYCIVEDYTHIWKYILILFVAFPITKYVDF